mmetsp:Transcript_10089/g.22117  ORF Transcript_10089/g.22117 Transcript_10089/m.22117 type:complete len:1723 (-) Transcript_10089:284-5452(-)
MLVPQAQQPRVPMQQPPTNGQGPGPGVQYQQQQQQQQAYMQQAAPQQQQQRQQSLTGTTNYAPAPAQPQQVQQQQQQQHFPHQGLNGGWQSDKDYHDRRKMIAKIVHLLQQRKPNAPPEWLKKLPQMAKRLEESLYRSAKSFAEYNDAGTLKMRLQQLAVNIGMKTKKMQQQQAILQHQKTQTARPLQQQPQQQQQQQQPPPPRTQPVVTQPAPAPMAPQQARAPVPMQQQQQQQQQRMAPQQQQRVSATAAPKVAQQQQQQRQQQQQQRGSINGQRMVNMSDINPIMAQQAPAPAAPVPAPQQQPPPQQQQQTAAPASLFGGVPVPAAGAPGPDAPNGRQNSDRQQVLRHQQQRLLLLRHAAKCQHEDGRCPVTPHCAGMKRLWKHIAECKNQKCLVPHCVSSRYVLSHYHRCKDVRCPVCGPVREAIHRSHEKQKQMQALRQRHQDAVLKQQQQPPQSASGVMPTSSMGTVSGSIPTEPAHAPAPVPPSTLSQPGEQRPNKRPKVGSGPIPPQPTYPVSSQPPMAQVQQQAQVQQPMPQQPNSVGQMPPVQAMSGQAPPVQQQPPMPGKPTVSAPPGAVVQGRQIIMPKHTGPKPQEDHTLINCFTLEQIETHIASLNTGLQLSPPRLKAKCLEVLKVLQSHQHAWVFNTPVDPVELNLPDYFEVIKKPMDLGTIRKKLENGVYTRLEEFEEHVHLTFGNAMLYNPEGTVVYNMAKDMKIKFEADYKTLLEQLEAEEDVKRRNGEACLLCGCEKLLFEPPVFYCNGFNCPSKRIRRNSYYYVGGNNQYHWCHTCFQELKDNSSIDLGDITVKKEGLVKKKNDEVHEESWVQCDRCERWVHQICALFNTRQNKDQRSEYACPRCTIEDRKKKGISDATSSTPMADDLPRTKLSEYLENHVRDKVNAFLDKKAADKAVVEKIPVEEARKKIEMGGDITIRQVTSMDRKVEVKERMLKRYAFKNYPEEFGYRCKCIVVFQNLDGVDVILFGLYVYEHGPENPSPNARTVYVSYLDSVHYMRPRQMRTFIYHEILISYLDYVRRRGYKSAHIWACPPLKGDDYILYAKPEDQKTPRDDRLRQWYIDMLVECQRRGIVGKLTNMYDLYFANEKNDATIVPYMEGDYFISEVENIIKDIEEGKSCKKKDQQGKKKKNDKKKKSGRGGTRSAGLDEEALKASGMVVKDNRTIEEGGRDYVMVKLGETIQPMKESFIVAYLAWDGAPEEDMEVPVEIKEYREKNGITWKLPKSETNSGEEKKEGAETNETDGDVVMKDATKEDEPKTDAPAPAAATPTTANTTAAPAPGSAPTGAPQNSTTSAAPPAADPAPASTPANPATTTAPTPAAGTAPATTNTPAPGPAPADVNVAAPTAAPGPAPAAAPTNPAPAPVTNSAPGSTPDPEPTSTTAAAPAAPAAPTGETKAGDEQSAASAAAAAAAMGGKNFAAMAARKRDREGTPIEDEKDKKKGEEKPAEKKEKPKEEKKAVFVKNRKGQMVKVLDDDDEELDCEFLNNRQAFLNLCQGNHYQYDHLRRAKHSSMMVLWHLHNRDAPKFVQQCATCSREILSGYRFHCTVCADFDQCQECLQNPNIPRHPHQLKPLPVSGQQTELTEAQRKERQRSIQLHMTLLLHAATCTAAKCPSANCVKMKGLLKHGQQCRIKATGGCSVCKRIWALLQIHARQCKAKQCPVPNCMAIRERMRQLKKQQQAMDDRRRQEMNRAYRGKR